MFLFILESIGTSELLLIGVVALIFLGPRRMPEMARKIGKMMAEFRGTANEFKETWQREVDFEAEAKSLDLNEIEAEAATPVKRATSIYPAAAAPTDTDDSSAIDRPTIKEVDAETLERLKAQHAAGSETAVEAVPDTPNPAATAALDPDDKQNWL